MLSLQLCRVGWTLIPLVCGGYEPVCTLAVSVSFGADILFSLVACIARRIPSTCPHHLRLGPEGVWLFSVAC